MTIAPVRAGRIYSYVNDQGIQVLTNVGANRSRKAKDPSDESLTPPLSNGTLDRAEIYYPTIEELSRQYSVDPDLVKAIIKVESDYFSTAESPKGAKGLMQLLPDTARRFGVQDIWDPTQNIEGGVKYLRFLMNFFHQDMRRVVAAYNAGENAVTRYKGIPPYEETREYVKRVSSLYDLTSESASAEDPPTRRRKVYRVVNSDGSVLLTDSPPEPITD